MKITGGARGKTAVLGIIPIKVNVGKNNVDTRKSLWNQDSIFNLVT